jgi:hypothetical protein
MRRRPDGADFRAASIVDAERRVIEEESNEFGASDEEEPPSDDTGDVKI